MPPRQKLEITIIIFSQKKVPDFLKILMLCNFFLDKVIYFSYYLIKSVIPITKTKRRRCNLDDKIHEKRVNVCFVGLHVGHFGIHRLY